MSGPNRWEAMARRTGLDSWRGINGLDRELFVCGFRLSGDELPGWTLHSSRPVAVPGWPRGARTMWRGHSNDALLRVDVYESPSRLIAHHLIVLLLLDFEAPTVVRRTEGTVGDVSFGGPTPEVALFARGNIVMAIRRAGRRPVDAWAQASRLDELLCEPLDDTGTVKWYDAEPSDVGDAAPFAEVGPCLGGNEWLKLRSTSGIVYEQSGELYYHHADPGPVDLAVHRISHRSTPPPPDAR